MTRYKPPEERASETVTFRLTFEERKMLDYLAEAKQKSLTDLIRYLLNEQAEKMGLGVAPSSRAQKRSGKQKRHKRKQGTGVLPVSDTRAAGQKEGLGLSGGGAGFFGDLVSLFREHFSGRAEGTKKELEETIRFLCDDTEGESILSFDMSLGELTSAKLTDVRTVLMKSDIRLAKKNLHLTYLRMMLHFGAKQKVVGLNVNPAVYLKPLTMAEVPESWPLYNPPDST